MRHFMAGAGHRRAICRRELQQIVQLHRLHVSAELMEAVIGAREHSEVEVELGARRHDQRQLRMVRSFSL